MSYKVLLTRSAERDLEDIYSYIAENDTQGNADYVLDKLTGDRKTGIIYLITDGRRNMQALLTRRMLWG